MTAALTALFAAAASALRAYPVWIAFRLALTLKRLDDDILYEARVSATRDRLLLLKAQHARLSRLYAIVCPPLVEAPSGDSVHSQDRRDMGQPTGLP